MAPRTGNDTLRRMIDASRAPRVPCERYLASLSHQDEQGEQSPFATLRCVALLSTVADRIDFGAERPIDLIDTTIELARDLPEDRFGCAAACNAAADELSEWLNSAYEH